MYLHIENFSKLDKRHPPTDEGTLAKPEQVREGRGCKQTGLWEDGGGRLGAGASPSRVPWGSALSLCPSRLPSLCLSWAILVTCGKPGNKRKLKNTQKNMGHYSGRSHSKT